jgi:hypothetical protein
MESTEDMEATSPIREDRAIRVRKALALEEHCSGVQVGVPIREGPNQSELLAVVNLAEELSFDAVEV